MKEDPRDEIEDLDTSARDERRRQIEMIQTLLDTAERTLNQAKGELQRLKRDLT